MSSSLDRRDRIIDVGCGNGTTAGMLSSIGFDVFGIDTSSSGIQVAKKAFPDIRFAERSAYSDLAEEFGLFDAVVCLEVIEHCYNPRLLASNIHALLEPGGIAVVSTPFHGYWKNLAIALSGKFDAHWSPLWDGGHIKFWSENTLRILLEETGFKAVEFRRVGRIPALAKSMIAIGRKPK